MATRDSEFYETHKFTPEPYQPPRQHGCFFYGCIIASVLAALILIAVGLLLYVAYRGFGQLVDQYTSTVPQELPKVEMPPETRQSLEERVSAFRKAIDGGEPLEPLVLTGDDLNALIERDSLWKGKIYVTIEGDKVKGKVSIPLEQISSVFETIGIGLLRGRYLNGEVELKASLNDGVLFVAFDSIEVNGKRLPEEVMSDLRRQNLAKDAYENPKNVEMIRKFESIVIKDGKLVITPRVAPGAPAGEKELPDEVLAPPEDGQPSPKAEPLKPEPSKSQPEPPRTAPQPASAEEPAKKP
jgi:hypothetical protein